jgi:hypothetical protein
MKVYAAYVYNDASPPRFVGMYSTYAKALLASSPRIDDMVKEFEIEPDDRSFPAISGTITACENCNVVLARDGEVVAQRPSTVCSHLNAGTYVNLNSVVDAVMDAQAELQTPLGFYRMYDPKYEHALPIEYDDHIEDRLAKTLARLHALLAALGTPMYRPAQHDEVEAIDLKATP